MTNSFSARTFWLIISYYEGRPSNQDRGRGGGLFEFGKVVFGKALKGRETEEQKE
jgi:hypothetical protein